VVPALIARASTGSSGEVAAEEVPIGRSVRREYLVDF
jgi:hypothetical protein